MLLLTHSRYIVVAQYIGMEEREENSRYHEALKWRQDHKHHTTLHQRLGRPRRHARRS